MMTHVCEEQRRERRVAGKLEHEPGREVPQTHRCLRLFGNVVEAFHEASGAEIQAALQLRTVLAQALEHGTSRGERKRMPHESARKESNANFGGGLIAISPCSTIERIEEACVAGDDPDRQTAAEYLTIGGQVSFHAEHGLHPAGMRSEASYDLVENQCSAGLCRDGAEFV